MNIDERERRHEIETISYSRKQETGIYSLFHPFSLNPSGRSKREKDGVKIRLKPEGIKRFSRDLNHKTLENSLPFTFVQLLEPFGD